MMFLFFNSLMHTPLIALTLIKMMEFSKYMEYLKIQIRKTILLYLNMQMVEVLIITTIISLGITIGMKN
jgi:hypothetical protein